MKPVKTIIISTLIIGSVAIGATAYANRNHSFQERMIDRISDQLDLNDTQVMALNGFAGELNETRTLMQGDPGVIRNEISNLVSSTTFDQGKALSMINDRAAALQNNAPELVAAAAVFFDGLDSAQKEKVSKFASKMHKHRGH